MTNFQQTLSTITDLLYIISSICLAWLFTQLMKKIPNPKP